jgi:hypothetical protein
MAIEVFEINAGLSAEEPGVVLLHSAIKTSRRGAGRRLFIAGPMIFNTRACGTCPNTLESRSSARGNLDSSQRERLGASKITGPENSPPRHLERDVRTHAVPDDDIAAKLGCDSPGRWRSSVCWPSRVAAY